MFTVFWFFLERISFKHGNEGKEKAEMCFLKLLCIKNKKIKKKSYLDRLRKSNLYITGKKDLMSIDLVDCSKLVELEVRELTDDIKKKYLLPTENTIAIHILQSIRHTCQPKKKVKEGQATYCGDVLCATNGRASLRRKRDTHTHTDNSSNIQVLNPM